MVGRVERICDVCGSNAGFARADDGFFYCLSCNSQADDIFDTGVDEEQVFNHYSASCNRARPSNPIAAVPTSQVNHDTSQYLYHTNIFADGMGDTMADHDGPRDFGSCKRKFSYEDYYSEIRSRYVTGLQVMIQLQCQALVEKFNVSPLLIGLAGPLWLRFLASTRIMADDWADRAVHDSETQTQGELEEFQPSAKSRDEPVNIHGKRLVYVWYKSLRNKIPISCSLAITFLVSHVAREAILPHDILKLVLEGKLPYFAAFSEIEKQLGSHSGACPIRASHMFRPTHALSSQKLEALAADIANKISLELPPVNFYAIASRYCRQLSLPTKDILPLACHISEWSMPSELYLSTNELRIPTRACVMSILIVAIRILFDINGYGMWESNLASLDSLPSRVKNAETASPDHLKATENADRESPCNNPERFETKSEIQDSELSVVKLLQILEAKYNELNDRPAYSCDLLSYLQYCREIVFSGLRPSYTDLEEEKLLDDFWEFYQNKELAATTDNQRVNFSESGGLNSKRSSGECRQEEAKEQGCDASHNGNNRSACDVDQENSSGSGRDSAKGSQPPDGLNESIKDKAIKQLMLDMEENRFCYIPPRSRIKSRDYLHYARRKRHVYIYAVHADYYILLRSCAKLAQVETRIMHIAVLTLERKLEWLEKRIGSSLHLKPSLDFVCNLCDSESVQNAGNDPMNLSC